MVPASTSVVKNPGPALAVPGSGCEQRHRTGRTLQRRPQRAEILLCQRVRTRVVVRPMEEVDRQVQLPEYPRQINADDLLPKTETPGERSPPPQMELLPTVYWETPPRGRKIPVITDPMSCGPDSQTVHGLVAHGEIGSGVPPAMLTGAFSSAHHAQVTSVPVRSQHVVVGQRLDPSWMGHLGHADVGLVPPGARAATWMPMKLPMSVPAGRS